MYCCFKSKLSFVSIFILLFSSVVFAGNLSSSLLFNLIKNNESNIIVLNRKVNSMQDNYANYYNEIINLKGEVSRLKRDNYNLKAEIKDLKSQMVRDRHDIQKRLNSMIDRIVKETDRAISKVSRQSYFKSVSKSSSGRRRVARKRHRKSGNKEDGYIVYTVQPGATLSAIAKAYNVTVEDIKKANDMDSDIIRVGEKLYIPQK